MISSMMIVGSLNGEIKKCLQKKKCMQKKKCKHTHKKIIKNAINKKLKKNLLLYKGWQQENQESTARHNSTQARNLNMRDTTETWLVCSKTMSKKLTLIDGKKHQQLKLTEAMIFTLEEVMSSNNYPRQQSNWCIKGLDLR